MTRLVLVGLLFLLSLLVLFRAPTNLLWYVAILVTEFCWIFVIVVLLLLFWRFGNPQLYVVTNLAGLVALVIFLLPLLQAALLSKDLPKRLAVAFGEASVAGAPAPFRPLQIVTGIGAKAVAHTRLVYDTTNNLLLDFYPSQQSGLRPLVLVIHGGSWAAGDSRQLPELNSVLAKAGYHVASIDYRLAPKHHFPAPVEDVDSALHFLCAQASNLRIDTNRITLLGRSAGGQIALSAAYLKNDPRVNGVIAFYGPADMIWGYENPTSPLVLDSRRVMRDYLGGALKEKPEQYRLSSATETVTAATPPTLLLYAERDPLVSPRHGDRLTKHLVEKNIPHFALYLPWATHAFDYTLNGPGGQLSTWTVLRFLTFVNAHTQTKDPAKKPGR